MLLATNYMNRGNTVYICDRCGLELKRDTNEIYSIYIRKSSDSTMKKKWDLCKRDYKALCRGIEKNNK